MGNPEELAIARKTITALKTKPLKAAYSQLMTAVQTGSEKAISKATYVAVQEKSRYIAERIAKTEIARAWADGFNASVANDSDIVGVRWRVSTGHPAFDICDLYAKADMYGLGKGVYPKNNMPQLPAHPFCMCRMVEVIRGELDLSKKSNRIKDAGDEWLNGLTDRQAPRRSWKQGRAGMAKTATIGVSTCVNWQTLGTPNTRLQNIPLSDKIMIIEGHGAAPLIYKPMGIIDRLGNDKKVETRVYYNKDGAKSS